VVVPDIDRTHLVAHVSLAAGVTLESVVEAAKDLLAQGLRPARYIQYDEIPRNSNGKVDRDALSYRQRMATAPADHGSQWFAVESHGRTGRENEVARAWASVLGLVDIPPDVNFFDLGGHSLGMFKLQNALEEQTGYRPSVVDLFQHTTVSAQALLIERGGSSGTRGSAERLPRSIENRWSAQRARRQRGDS
jgi:Phosphopantetheine attachment site